MACWDGGRLHVPPGMGDLASCRAAVCWDAAARGIPPALHAQGGAGLGKGGTGLSPMPTRGGECCLHPRVYSTGSSPRQHIPSSSRCDECRECSEHAGDSVPQLPGCRGSPTALTAPGQGLYQVRAAPCKPSLCPGSTGSSPKVSAPPSSTLLRTAAGWAPAPAWMLWLHAELGQG